MKLITKIPHSTILRLSEICGLILPFVFFCSIALSITFSPWFNWFVHALSDMGIRSTSALFFNSGMIICGLLLFVFSFGIPIDFVNKKGIYLLRISGFSLVGIGFFPQNIFLIHYLFSVTFFISLMISLIFLSDQKNDDQLFSLLASMGKKILLLTGLGTIFSFFILQSIALAEILLILPIFFWIMVYGSILLSKKYQDTLLYHAHNK